MPFALTPLRRTIGRHLVAAAILAAQLPSASVADEVAPSMWFFSPPVGRTPPLTAFDNQPSSFVDAWIDAALHEQGQVANPPADQRTLGRRLALDLTGLPPSASSLDAMVSDPRPDAIQRWVNRLLSSPSFGEHQTRYWLDLVRYADTHGLNLDNFRQIYPYRDWVIAAMNDSLPLDQFITDQLAGDLIAFPTRNQLIATGLGRLNLSTGEDGSIVEEVDARNLIDRTDAFGTIFLGLSIGCAACHDHPYDPITQSEYYSLAAYFHSLDGHAVDGNAKDHAPSLAVPTDEQTKQLAELDRELAKLETLGSDQSQFLDAAQRRWETSLVESAPSAPVHLSDCHLIGPIPVSGPDSAYREELAGERTDAFNHGDALRSGNLLLRWQHRGDWMPAQPESLPRFGDRDNATILHQRINATTPATIELIFDTDDGHVVTLNGELLRQRTGTATLVPQRTRLPLRLRAGENHLFIKQVHHGGAARIDIAFRSPLVQTPAAILELIGIPEAKRTTRQQDFLKTFYRVAVDQQPETLVAADIRRGLLTLRDELVSSIPTTLIWRETRTPRSTRVLDGGRYDAPGREVTRGVPGSLPPLPSDAPNNRLGLARWLVDPRHPLTARVIVNRHWQQLFGVGLVEQSEDLGSQSEPPTHPELLDALALTLQHDRWDLKRLIQRLVMTNAYQRGASATPEQLAADPINRWLARASRPRLDAETIRDQTLELAGLLVHKIGGPSVKPPQPDGWWEAVGYTTSNTARFVADSGADAHRRGVYTFWKRTSPPPTMTSLDAPSRESCTSRRPRTNTPLQSLLLLNESQRFAAAERLAINALSSHTDHANRLADLFRTVLLREPEPIEFETLTDLLEALREDVKKNSGASNGFTIDIDTERLAWTMLASTLLNLDEGLCR